MIHSLPETFAFALIGFILGKCFFLKKKSQRFWKSIIQGEFLHRLSLYRGKKDVRRLFSNRHQQHWKCPCLLLLAVLIIVSGGQNYGPHQLCLRIIPVTVVWALIRVSGAMDNSVEDETIFSKSSVPLPPSLLH